MNIGPYPRGYSGLCFEMCTVQMGVKEQTKQNSDKLSRALNITSKRAVTIVLTGLVKLY